ncbi:unnamed protein product [Symbiodinium natans]|uniref:Ubiquitin-like domain-containing protein n=1 Tax=Symbiodinium natans TaxID=878477 RepID=A0A812NSX9_9DINO|nr:unnamed protein product [Symbiodinium natans]
MGLPVDEESIKVRRRRFLHLLSSASAKFDQAATESTKQFAEGEDKSTLSEEEFARWFRELLKESIGKHVEKQVPLPKMEMLTVKVKSLGGTEKEVEVPADCTVSMLAEAAAAELDLPYAQTKISVNGEVVPDSALLSSLELGSDPEVTAVVMDTIKVRRHVYNMRGGGPERRGYALLATDEVELPPRAKLADHLDKLVPQEGYSHRRPEEFDLKAFQATPSSQVPKKWQGGMNEVDVDLDATAEQVFGVDGHVELSVLVPMRGLD